VRLQKGLIVYDPLDLVVLQVHDPGVEPVLARVVLTPHGTYPPYDYVRAYPAAERERWEPPTDELYAAYELAEAAYHTARVWADTL
jgi:hypothetical protein